ncbi:MAG: tetratricopeptide repeat protein [Planctomycetota bacterium]
MTERPTLESLRETLAEAECLHGPGDLKTGLAAVQLAVFRQHAGREGEAEAEVLARRALAIFEPGPQHPSGRLRCGPLRVLSYLAGRRDDKIEAEALLRRAIEIQRDGDEDILCSDDDMLTLGYQLLDQQRFVEAAEFLQRGIRVVEQHFGSEYRSLVSFLEPLARAYVGMKRYDEAIEILRRALSLPPSHTLSALDEACRFVEEIAAIHLKAERPEAANEAFAEAHQLRMQTDIEIGEFCGDKPHYDPQKEVMEGAVAQADALAERKDFAEAIRLVEEVVRHNATRTEAPVGWQHELHRKLARWKSELKQYAEAETLLDQSRAYLEPKGVPLEELKRLLSEQKASGYPLKPLPYFYIEPLGWIWNEFGLIYDRTGRFDEAVQAFDKSADIWKVTHEIDGGFVSSALLSVGSICCKRGELDKASDRMEEALAWEERLQPEGSKMALLYANLAAVREKQGRITEAAQLRLSAAERLLRNEGTGHIGVMMELNEAGQLFQRLSDWDRARSCYQRVLGLVRETVLDNPQPLVGVLINLAHVAVHQNRFDEAAVALREALPVCEREPDRLQSEHHAVLLRLTEALVQIPHFDEAETVGLRWLAYLDKHAAGNDPEFPAALANLAQAYYGQNQHEQALRLIERAIPLVERCARPNDPSVAVYFHVYANILGKLGRHPDATAAVTRARQIEAQGKPKR